MLWMKERIKPDTCEFMIIFRTESIVWIPQRHIRRWLPVCCQRSNVFPTATIFMRKFAIERCLERASSTLFLNRSLMVSTTYPFQSITYLRRHELVLHVVPDTIDYTYAVIEEAFKQPWRDVPLFAKTLPYKYPKSSCRHFLAYLTKDKKITIRKQSLITNIITTYSNFLSD